MHKQTPEITDMDSNTHTQHFDDASMLNASQNQASSHITAPSALLSDEIEINETATSSTQHSQSTHQTQAVTNPAETQADGVIRSGVSLSRRSFLQSTTAAVASASLVGCMSDSDSKNKVSRFGIKPKDVEFAHGVASGDPLKDRVIIWTRVTPVNTSGELSVGWQIATDATMNNVVNSGTSSTSAKHDYTVKVDADGLQADTVYYYRFSVDGIYSPIGRTKTLPVDNVQQVKLAVFSCANFPAGYFHSYADAAKQTDIDVAIHLGDYIYEYGRYDEDNSKGGEIKKDANGNPMPAYASANAEQLKRQVQPATEAFSIDDYRTRHAQYKTDKDLQALHAQMPMIAIWDDHEVANDSYTDGAENHQTKEGQWDKRKLAAMTAFHEWMPTRNQTVNRIYRSFNFGNLLSLHMLDTRIIGRQKQLEYKNYIQIAQDGQIGFDANKFATDLSNPNRQLLGLAQHNWLAGQLQASTATWQVLGQQVLMGRMFIPSPILLNFQNSKAGVDVLTYLKLRSKATQTPDALTDAEKAILQQPFVPYNLDAWDGYSVARESLLSVVKALQKNLVVLAGDTHNAWASNLTNAAGDAIGVEFATSSVTSPGFEQYLADIPPSLFAQVIPTLIKSGTLKYTDSSQRGYLILTVTPEKCQSDWVFVSDILKPEYTAKVGKTLSVNKNTHTLA